MVACVPVVDSAIVFAVIFAGRLPLPSANQAREAPLDTGPCYVQGFKYVGFVVTRSWQRHTHRCMVSHLRPAADNMIHRQKPPCTDVCMCVKLYMSVNMLDVGIDSYRYVYMYEGTYTCLQEFLFAYVCTYLGGQVSGPSGRHVGRHICIYT